jgi:hypothetical protein
MSVAICSTQRSTLKQTVTFIEYYQHIGAIKIFIYFDDPKDENYNIVKDMENVQAILCNDEYWQKEGRSESIEKRQMINSNHAITLCREQNIAWLLHIDVDEFIYLDKKNTLNDYFNVFSNNIVTVRFPVCEAIPTAEEHNDFLTEITHFRSHPICYRNSMKMKTLLKIRIKLNLLFTKVKKIILTITDSKPYLTYGYMKAHIAGKSATRVNADVQLMGLHSSKINYKDNEYGTVANDAVILHYDAFSYEAWFQKWQKRVDGSGLSTLMHKERNQQLIDFNEHYETNDVNSLKSLYRKIYFIKSKDYSLLKLLGFVRKITLNNKKN